MDRPIQPTPLQTREQTRNCAMFSFQHVCDSEGIPAPSEYALKAGLDRRNVPVPEPPRGEDGDCDLAQHVKATGSALCQILVCQFDT
jgi:hypothetical protein